MVYLLQMVVFHGKLLNNQMVPWVDHNVKQSGDVTHQAIERHLWREFRRGLFLAFHAEGHGFICWIQDSHSYGRLPIIMAHNWIHHPQIYKLYGWHLISSWWCIPSDIPVIVLSYISHISNTPRWCLFCGHLQLVVNPPNEECPKAKMVGAELLA